MVPVLTHFVVENVSRDMLKEVASARSSRAAPLTKARLNSCRFHLQSTLIYFGSDKIPVKVFPSDIPLEELIVLAQKFLTPDQFDDVATHRAELDKCGWIRCQSGKLPVEEAAARMWNLSYTSALVHDVATMRNFCSHKCYTQFMSFKQDLSTEVLVARRNCGALVAAMAASELGGCSMETAPQTVMEAAEVEQALVEQSQQGDVSKLDIAAPKAKQCRVWQGSAMSRAQLSAKSTQALVSYEYSVNESDLAVGGQHWEPTSQRGVEEPQKIQPHALVDISRAEKNDSDGSDEFPSEEISCCKRSG
eukprot:GHVN01034096.1.p1 GENE.GHVN01034096.1~~GHVN01034096.1.p1  ORF type:complete len:341 (+),score=27.97 GHVN01034096.1:108-1025(+)